MSDADFAASVLANVRPEIREEVAYALKLAEASCPICEGTGRATWLDDCEECRSQAGTTEPVDPLREEAMVLAALKEETR